MADSVSLRTPAQSPTVIFRPDPYAGPTYAHSTCAPLSTGHGLHVRSSKRLDEVEMSRCGEQDYLSFRMTAAEARAIAAELVAAADAAELAKEVAHG